MMPRFLSFKSLSFLLFVGLLLSAKCQRKEVQASKIKFDLSKIDEEGLREGRVAVDYEFCIPAKGNLAAAVKKIDPSLRIQKTAKGRIECSASQWLCMGNTHQKNYKSILYDLTALDYVERIEETFFE